MQYETRTAPLADLQFVLSVMEERDHLGLDDEGAGTVRRILRHRIDEAERKLPRKTAAPAPVRLLT
jgi:hypothetical protein